MDNESALSKSIDIPEIEVLNWDESTSSIDLFFRVALYQFTNDASMVQIGNKSMLGASAPINEYRISMFYVL